MKQSTMERKPIHKTYHDVDLPAERGFLVGMELKDKPGAFSVEDSLEELAQLARTVGIEVVGGTYQRLQRVTPATYIGSGKVEELQAWRDELQVDVMIFDEELSPRQQRELEEALNIKILDRTALILDIFAQHAHTREGQLQVELAQYEYRLPRLTRMWQHLARQAGGGAARGGAAGVGLRGPGEMQLESDRREIRRRIAQVRQELEEVRAHRARYRRHRQRAAIPVVAIVGYTNAGKSTLLNALSGADVYTADQLFATLDPTTRRVSLPNGGEVLLTDTVGFIQKLPAHLIAAFRATLEEITEASLILHIVDITHLNAAQQAQTVEETLRDLGVTERPIIVALNKIDLLHDPADVSEMLAQFPNNLAISAREGIGLDRLLSRIERVLEQAMMPLYVCVPYTRGDLVALAHKVGALEKEEYRPAGTLLIGRLPGRYLSAFKPYRLDGSRDDNGKENEDYD
jgi:GTP-binding protein HflX